MTADYDLALMLVGVFVAGLLLGLIACCTTWSASCIRCKDRWTL